MTDEELMHFGVKGMKWGRRKSYSMSSDHKNVSKLRKKKVPELTNKELETVNKRLNLEKSFKNLNPSTIKQGQNHVNQTLALVATVTSVVALAQSPYGKAVIKAGKNAIYKTKYLTGITKAITAG